MKIYKYIKTTIHPKHKIESSDFFDNRRSLLLCAVINDAWVNVTQTLKKVFESFLGLNKKLETEKLRLLRLHPALDSLKH